MKILILSLLLCVIGIVLIALEKLRKRQKNGAVLSEPLNTNTVTVNAMTFEDIFNTMANANEVREWINMNHHKYGFFDEWPRGGGQGLMIHGMRKCKFAKELEQDVKKIEEFWYLGKMPWLILAL